MYMCDPSLAPASFTPCTILFNTGSWQIQLQMPRTRHALCAYLILRLMVYPPLDST